MAEQLSEHRKDVLPVLAAAAAAVMSLPLSFQFMAHIIQAMAGYVNILSLPAVFLYLLMYLPVAVVTAVAYKTGYRLFAKAYLLGYTIVFVVNLTLGVALLV